MAYLDPQCEKIDHKPGVIRWIFTSIIFTILIAASLFLPAGTLNWQVVLVYVAIFAVIQILDAIVLIPISPELLGERSRNQSGVKKWDQFLSRIMATIGLMTIWIVSGLDYRYSWYPRFPDWLFILSVSMEFMGGLLVLCTMASNRFLFAFKKNVVTL